MGEGLDLVQIQKFVIEMYYLDMTVIRHDLLKQVNMHLVEGSGCLTSR